MVSSEKTSNQVLRIADANINRIGEGLRFLEEISRMLLNDGTLTQQLKTMRHEMVRADIQLNRQMISARNSENDVGMDIEVHGEARQRELPDTVVANSRRVQESLRVMEEIAKLPYISLDPEKFKHARFSAYNIEKILLSRLLRTDKTGKLTGLYVIIDPVALNNRNHKEVASQAIRGGARVIQLRDKFHTRKQAIAMAKEIKGICAENDVIFIVNDSLDIAMAADADGLHVGQEDLPVSIARRFLPVDKIIGCSAATVEEAVTAQSEGADYIGVGAIYPTASKEAIDVVGTERLRQIRQAVSLPIVAIGGIKQSNTAEVRASGADSVAIISSILDSEDIEENSRLIANIFEKDI